MFNWLTDFFSGGQTQSDAQANLDAEKAAYIKQLNSRLQSGTISPEFYQAEVYRLQYEFNLEDPTGEVWQAFADQFVIDAENLPATIKDGVTGAAGWIGGTVGDASGALLGGTVGGIAKGLWRGVPIWVWLLLAGAVAFLVWGLAKGKIKPIAIPI